MVHEGSVRKFISATCRFNHQPRRFPPHRRALIHFFFLVLLLSVCALNSVSAFLYRPVSRRASFLVRYYHNEKSNPSSKPTSSDTTSENPSPAAEPTKSPNPGGGSWFSLDQLNQLKESIDIVSVIESYGLQQFQRKGNDRATAICPFHKDTNPSLSIDGKRKIYKCFSCGAGGDVFKFVREYSRLRGEELSFYQAVRHVSREFGDGTFGSGSSSSSYTPRLSEEERQALQQQKERILLANAAAAAYYTDCLSKPFAGGARYHLQSRGISGATARAFCLGFAPDVYFGPGRRAPWGSGSLVEHLRGLDFAPQEILDAGLAIRTKKSFENTDSIFVEDNSREAAPSTNTTEADLLDYNGLMDRFRGRLVVPIFDVTGKKVLGFGGRILPSSDAAVEAQSDFQVPKYLNSPESAVFQKKNILFGEHQARDAIRKANVDEGVVSPSNVIIVEGYMDAIALWQVGIKEVVASMGTALSSEQLASAAKTAGTRGGRIILCLDNDTAGIGAIERLCGNGMLSDTVNSFGVEIVVATLPDGLKDPAEFIESRTGQKKSDRVADSLHSEVFESALEWTDWYLKRLFDDYDPSAARGRPHSFGDIFERVAQFLANSMASADRTKRAYEVAGSLAAIMAKETNATEVSSAVRNQLESDLIDLAARLSEAKRAVHQRSGSFGGQSTPGARSILSSLTRGHGPSGSDDDVAKLSRQARGTGSSERIISSDSETSTVEAAGSRSKRGRARDQARRRTYKPTNRKIKKVKPLTPHFAGFQFARQSDMDWLGIPKETWKRKPTDLTLGYVPPFPTQGDRGLLGGRTHEFALNPSAALHEKLVYFNSNDFHGQQFLSDDAMDAGYTGEEIKADPSLIEKGVGSLVEQDIPRMALVAEDSLLRALVLHGSARTTVKNILDARNAVNATDAGIKWSCEEKEWLFGTLVNGSDKIPLDCPSPNELRSFVAGLPGSPPDAFGELFLSDDSHDGTKVVEAATSKLDPDKHVPSAHSMETNVLFAEDDPLTHIGEAEGSLTINPSTNIDDSVSIAKKDDSRYLGNFSEAPTSGTLDPFFRCRNDVAALAQDESRSEERETRAELVVQELLATLFWTSAAQHCQTLRQELETTLNELCCLSSSSEENESSEPSTELSFTDAYKGDVDLGDSTDLASQKAELEEQCCGLVEGIRDATASLQQLAESAKRITSRLIDSGSSNGAEGRLSIALQQDLAAKVDEHLYALPSDAQPLVQESTGRDLLLGTVEDDEPFEDTLERIEKEWGEWVDEDYDWSPSSVKHQQSSLNEREANNLSFMDGYDDASDESLEDYSARIAADWEEWSD